MSSPWIEETDSSGRRRAWRCSGAELDFLQVEAGNLFHSQSPNSVSVYEIKQAAKVHK